MTPPFVDRPLAEEGLLHCNNIALRFAILENPAWRAQPLVANLGPADRAKLSRDVGDLLVLWAQALARTAAGKTGRERADRLAAASKRLDVAEPCFGPRTPPVSLLLARADLMHLTGDSETERDFEHRLNAPPLGTELDGLIWEDPDRIGPEIGRQFVAAREIARRCATLRTGLCGLLWVTGTCAFTGYKPRRRTTVWRSHWRRGHGARFTTADSCSLI